MNRRSTLLANCTQVLAFVSQDNAADWLFSINEDNDEETILLIRYLIGDQAEEPIENVDPSRSEDNRDAYVNVGSVPTQSETVQEEAAVDLSSDKMTDFKTCESPPIQSIAWFLKT